MKNNWSNADAQKIITKAAKEGVSEDLALRIYTSRLIGKEPALVIHGGGNTSVKTRQSNFLGVEQDVICVKGSGWDLATIEVPGLPALELNPLRIIRERKTLTDEDMTAFLRLNLLDPAAPNPSVETLLHAFLPQKFIDHSHAAAILSLTDQPNGNEICREVFGERVAIVPYVMAGFLLAKDTADIAEAHPDIEGLILEKHGLFTFGDTAKQSYDRMIDLVTIAEEKIAATPPWLPTQIQTQEKPVPPSVIAPIIRGICATNVGGGAFTRLISDFRASEAIMTFVNGRDVNDYGTRGVVTPDHIIRTKNKYLIAPHPNLDHLDQFKSDLEKTLMQYRSTYNDYFEINNQRLGNIKQKLNPSPYVILVPSVGLFGLGANAKAASIAADLAEITIDVISDAERVGTFKPLGEADLFDMEYWSLEQAKLSKATSKTLEGQVVVITGAGGAIGSATARAFAAEGASLALLDIDKKTAADAAKDLNNAIAIHCDLTDDQSVKNAFSSVCNYFGGVDILISNAGSAWEASIGDMDDTLLRNSFEINFFAHQRVAKEAFAIMQSQGTGGALLFNVSKQAVNPGENFGAYGLPKASTLFLMRQYALEGGKLGIRSNAVNADRIRSGLLTDEMISKRAASRGLDGEEYLQSNLLRQEITADDVARAFLHHAQALKTTGDVTTVDGGNVAAMMR